VFVDEYQDINAAQDLIISGVSRGAIGGELGNRFLVGDIKQSIYGFRQADPSIFREYLRAAEVEKKWRAVFLSDNFRSHEGILNFINPIFGWLMQENVGGITYDAKAALKFGGKEGRGELAMREGERMPVELHLLMTSKETSGDPEEEETEDLEAAEMEARIVAGRLRELKERGQIIHHRRDGKRAVEWGDMVVLLRAASAKVEVYAKAFAAMGVPLETKRDGFFTTQEVLDLCSLLTILDNPLQDVPLLAVLRSPLVGLSANELAAVRIHAGKQVNFWTALNAYLKKQNEGSRKIELFLERFHRWRDPKQCFSLAQRLERVLAETGYAEWLISQGRGRQRYANVQQLLRVARQFDDARGESLYLFLRHIQELQESAGDIEPATIAEGNAVRLMTVHQSKGLEFPVVAVADLGKRFNTSDQNSSMQLHEKYGICAMIKAPEAPAQYKSLPLWLASREQKLSGLGEEMRVLYVALTRAENMLLLFGGATEKQLDKWENVGGGNLFPQQVLKTRSWLDWIGMHVNTRWPGCLAGTECDDVPFAVKVYHEAPKRCDEEKAAVKEIGEAERAAVKERIMFEYPHAAAVKEPGKTSVSTVRKRMNQAEKPDEEVALQKRFLNSKGGPREADGRTRGLASHRFLQHVALRGEFSEIALRKQAEALVRGGILDREELDSIDCEAIAAFWESVVGREIRERWNEVRRELPFTFKLGNDDLVNLGVESVLPMPEGEFVVTQGVADLVMLGEKEIWLIDFKTDSVTAKDVAAKATEYRGQIALYALALERIYGRAVTRRGLYFLAARRMEWLE
jgi:ATP-dependent helicase/nuclease subunit A